MNSVYAVFWREMIILSRRLKRMLASYAISPMLFMLAFGWGMGKGISVEGVDYLSYMVPGLFALSSMSQSFSIATDINVARFYWMTFEEFQTSPVSYLSVTLGEALAGMVRGLLAPLVITIVALLAGVKLHFSILLVMAVLLNSFQFSCGAILAAMKVRSHADQSTLTSFIIVPMSFLCGTFFPLERLPEWAGCLVGLLPLTHASHAIRAAALGQPFPWVSALVMVLYGGVFFLLATKSVRQASI